MRVTTFCSIDASKGYCAALNTSDSDWCFVVCVCACWSMHRRMCVCVFVHV